MRNKDPYWLTAKFDSQCKCGEKITRGQRIFYYPLTKTPLCPKCSDNASREFQESVFDERGY